MSDINILEFHEIYSENDIYDSLFQKVMEK